MRDNKTPQVVKGVATQVTRNSRAIFITSKKKRQVCFSKRKKGLIEKAAHLETATGAQVMVLITSETGKVYAYCSHGLKHVFELCIDNVFGTINQANWSEDSSS